MFTHSILGKYKTQMVKDAEKQICIKCNVKFNLKLL